MSIINIKNSIFIIILSILSTISTQASKEVVVDLTHQTAIAYQDGEVKFLVVYPQANQVERHPQVAFIS